MFAGRWLHWSVVGEEEPANQMYAFFRATKSVLPFSIVTATEMSLLRPQILVSARVRVLHGMAAAAKSPDDTAFDQSITRVSVQTVVPQLRRPLPKPAINLDVSKTTVSDWQIMNSNGRLNAYLQVSLFLYRVYTLWVYLTIKEYCIFSYPNTVSQC